jgi:hypothetical protein
MKLERLGEFKILTLRETVPPSALSNGDTPELIAEYYRNQIETDLRYTPEVETFQVIILSTRRKIQGHFLVSTGTLDTILVHPREVFRPAIVANAAAIVLVHNLCVAAHKLCYVERRFMCSDRLAALTLARVPRPKESYV